MPSTTQRYIGITDWDGEIGGEGGGWGGAFGVASVVNTPTPHLLWLVALIALTRQK
jgi:hypothetical protein